MVFHYDSVVGSPGANDNGTGAVAILALAEKFATLKPKRTLRFVEFVNEEPPFFWSENMGSWVYAQRCKERQENIVAMLSLETMGFYSQASNSQQYPVNILKLIYPNQGNFISFIGNISSRSLIHQAIGKFRNSAQFPSQGVSLPNFYSRGRVVRSLVILASWLSRFDGYRYCPLSLSLLSYSAGYSRTH